VELLAVCLRKDPPACDPLITGDLLFAELRGSKLF